MDESKVKNGKFVEEKFIVEYKNELYDVTQFLSKHPGGLNTLSGYNRKDIEEKFKKIEHSTSAEYLLNEYKLKQKIFSVEKTEDESIEHLVDWDSAMLQQISNLGERYHEWVNKPVDRSIRLFANPVLESLSKTPWYVPPIFWIPIISYLISIETVTIMKQNHESPTYFIVYNLIKGILLWTLIEYAMHKYLFHMNVSKSSKWSTFHFMLHGLHHKAPFDNSRLVFPPVPAAIITVILYQVLVCVNFISGGFLGHDKLLLAGALIGYLCYDMIHYYIHYGSPKNSYFYHLKRYHYNHHFVNHDKGFGISSPLWDIVFGTKIVLKKLKYMLRW